MRITQPRPEMQRSEGAPYTRTFPKKIKYGDRYHEDGYNKKCEKNQARIHIKSNFIKNSLHQMSWKHVGHKKQFFLLPPSS